ncbi:Hypothetical predicted protein [Olea europaea subsp. europaea]|uniref:Uncharacterized protein n=1 Tax=Olea europaea subsp. europaea TaxID=158383 RepID=A0A8S0RU16_OLEEU|nr:Hypothetical predicted protein [Olea europaea subsp. europaea]
MADVKSGEEERESTVKCKPDPPEPVDETLDKEEREADPTKKRKLETLSHNDAFSCAADDKKAELKQSSYPEDEEEDEYDDEEDYEGEEDDDEQQSDGEEAIVNSKGKGIARDDKGKGKLIEESDLDDDDDSSVDGESELSGVDSDLSDDPLAEVDLDNILPSRTRRGAAQPGLHISNDRNQGSDA